MNIFMEALSSSMAVAVEAFAASMSQSNELKLVELLAPEDCQIMAKIHGEETFSSEHACNPSTQDNQRAQTLARAKPAPV